MRTEYIELIKNFITKVSFSELVIVILVRIGMKQTFIIKTYDEIHAVYVYLGFLIIEFLYAAYYRKISKISKDLDGTVVRTKTKRPIVYSLNRETNSLRRNLYDSDK